MQFASRFALSTIALVASLFSLTGAHAVSLTEPVSPANFADTNLPGTTSAARPELAGGVLEDVITPFSFSGVTGTVQNRVVREDGTGTLDFYWKVNVDASTSGLGVSAFRLADFGYGNIKDADWRIDGLGNRSPDVARLFNQASYPTGDVNFLFFNGIAPGSQSNFFFLHTDATTYDSTAKFDLLTAGPQNLSGSFSTFAPRAAVPEPASNVLLAGGLLLMGGVLRLRRSA